MDKKILKVKEPIVNCFTSYGALFSIIPNIMSNWIFNNFIQIRYSYGWKMMVFDNHHLLLSNCPHISCYNMPKEILFRRYDSSVKSLLIEAINNNEYIFMWVDRFYIPCSMEYNIQHHSHEIFVYGYDLEKEIFYIADNFHEGKFIFSECKMSVIEDAYNNVGDFFWMTDISLLRVNYESEIPINIQQIIFELEKYLYSIKTFDVFFEHECIFGIGIINNVVNMIRKNYNFETLDIRFFHLLYEHKILMEMRVKYLIDNNYLNYNINIQHFTEIKKNSLNIRNVALKYNITKDKQILHHIADMLEDSIRQETKLLKKIVSQLKVAGDNS